MAKQNIVVEWKSCPGFSFVVGKFGSFRKASTIATVMSRCATCGPSCGASAYGCRRPIKRRCPYDGPRELGKYLAPYVMLYALRGVRRMTEAKLAPNLPGWMVEHANRYLSSGGADGQSTK